MRVFQDRWEYPMILTPCVKGWNTLTLFPASDGRAGASLDGTICAPWDPGHLKLFAGGGGMVPLQVDREFLSSSKVILMFYVLSGCFPEFMNPVLDNIFLISFHRTQCKCYFFPFLTTLSSPEGQWASHDISGLHTWDRAPRRIGTEFLTHVIMFWLWLCIQILSHSLYIYFMLGVHWMKSPSCKQHNNPTRDILVVSKYESRELRGGERLLAQGHLHGLGILLCCEMVLKTQAIIALTVLYPNSMPQGSTVQDLVQGKLCLPWEMDVVFFSSNIFSCFTAKTGHHLSMTQISVLL